MKTNWISRRRAFAAAVLVALVTCAVAYANTTLVKDPKGDVKCTDEAGHAKACGPTGGQFGVHDLKSVTAAHSGTKLKYVFVAYDTIGNIKKFTPFTVVMIVGTKHYLLGGGSGSQYKVHQMPSGKVTGSTTLRQVDSRTMAVTFSPSAIGNPRSYKWQAQEFGACETCPPEDRAPNRGYITHRLR